MSNFELDPQEVVLVPVDHEGKTLLFSEFKVEAVDTDYHTVRDANGVAVKLPPGRYEIRIYTRNMEMKTVSLMIVPHVSLYRFTVDSEVHNAAVQPGPEAEPPKPGTKKNVIEIEPRYLRTFPVAYRTHGGNWISTKSINISKTGVCLEQVGTIPEDENLYVRLHVPVSSIPIECPARVVWVKTEDFPQSRMGLQLYLTDNMRASLDNWLSPRKK